METPSIIRLNKTKDQLTIVFNDIDYLLRAEYLRVYSPSAEVRGHGLGQEILQIDKEQVIIHNIRQVGNYAIKLTFSDGHDTGIYSWDYLFMLAREHDKLWQHYLARLKEAGHKHSQLNQDD